MAQAIAFIVEKRAQRNALSFRNGIEMTEQGIWVRFWYTRGQQRTPTEGYQFYSYAGGWTPDDKKDTKERNEAWRKEAERWAEDKGCWASSRFKYGFEIVDKPPMEWLQQQYRYFSKKAEFFKKYLD